MICLSVCFSVLAVCISITFAQNDKFDYECDILSRLDYLENAFSAAMETQAAIRAQLKEAEDTILSLTNQLKGNISPGATFVRWGRTTCPGNGTELVYSGLAGGSNYQNSGAAVNYLCLPKTPVYGEYYEDATQNGAYVYGAEYQLDSRTNTMKFFPDLAHSINLYDNNVPCAVCRTHRATVLMVPAQNICMEGWTLEYKGLLVSEYTGHTAASEYICLDDKPEIIAGGGRNEDGKLLYFVEGQCGSLTCPPYVNGRELTCSVCTK